MITQTISHAEDLQGSAPRPNSRRSKLTKAPVLQLVPRFSRTDAANGSVTENELLALLEMVKSGEIVGLAYVGMRPGAQDPVIGAVGRASQAIESTVFWLERLRLKLLYSK